MQSPTPGFSFGMRMGCVREDNGLSMSAMAKSLHIAPSTWKSYENDCTFGVLALMFKLTGFIFKALGKIFGFIFSIAGYLIIGVVAVGVFGLALFSIPIIMLAGLAAVIAAVA